MYLSNKKISSIKVVTIIGAAGGAGFYIAKFFAILGKTVCGYDLKNNPQTDELEKLGAHISYKNPTNFKFTKSDLIIYTNALPVKIIQSIINSNPRNKVITTGVCYNEIVKIYENINSSKYPLITEAVKKSEIAPLFDIDFKDCILIGITGSKGKTTTSYMLYETLKHLEARVSCCTTIGAKILDKEMETGLHTSTPSAQELARLIKEMLKVKSKIIVLEVSSHAIATGRISGLKFDISVITNIQPEHLDFHKTIENVINIKKQLVTSYLKPGGLAIVNTDDKNIKNYVIPEIIKESKNYVTFGEQKFQGSRLHVKAVNIKEKNSLVEFDLSKYKNKNIYKYLVNFPGKFNVFNIIPAIIISEIFRYKENIIAKATSKIGVISGRNEVIQDSPFKVILDFAHTPESLEAILGTYHRSKNQKNKLIVVFGAAGQRDKLKRPRMGEAAAKFADITILTAEDPRTEELAVINSQIKKGWLNYIKKNRLENTKTLLEFNNISEGTKCRKDAIKKAISLAKTGDVVVCSGKGPEKSMCIGLKEYTWDEKKLIKNILDKN